MATLLLRLSGPMQAWGATSRFDERDSGLEPSKSGVLGMVCAALGGDRSEPIHDLAAMQMWVGVDREGVLLRDHQTATGVMLASGKVDQKPYGNQPRFYLADATFLVAFEGDRYMLEGIQKALRSPVWPIELGRESMPPGEPVGLSEGVHDQPLGNLLRSYPKTARGRCEDREEPVRLLLEDALEGVVPIDQPLHPFAERRFGPRFVREETLNVSIEAVN